MAIGKPTVIYADDSVEALHLVNVVAGKDYRFDIELVTSGEDLLSRMRNHKYSAALIDLNLGETLSGTILAAKVREIYPDIHIVIYTGYVVERVKMLLNRQELESGLIQVWSKSDLEIDDIADKIANLVSGGQNNAT